MRNEQPIEYKMSKQMFDTLCKTRSGEDKKANPYIYVMNVINEQFGLRGKVVQLHVIG